MVAHALIEPKPRHVIGAGALLALSFTLKETVFILGFAGACFVVVLAVVASRSPVGSARRFFSRMRRMGTFALDVEHHRLRRHEVLAHSAQVGRGSQHWYFYATVYAGCE